MTYRAEASDAVASAQWAGSNAVTSRNRAEECGKFFS